MKDDDSKIYSAVELRNQGLKLTEISELLDIPKRVLTKEINKIQIIKGFQYEIFPTEEQAEYIQKHFDASRFVYNWGLSEKTKWYNYYKIVKTIENLEKQKMLTSEELAESKKIVEVRKEIYLKEPNDIIIKLHNGREIVPNWWTKKKGLSKRLTYEFKVTNKFIKDNQLGDKPLRYSLDHLDKSFDNFFRRPSRDTYPKFHSKYTSEKSIHFQEGFRLDFDNNKVTIPVISGKFGPVKANIHRTFEGRIVSGSVKYHSAGHYFVNLQVETNELKPPLKEVTDLKKIVGIDLGVGEDNYCVFSDGTTIKKPRHYEENKKRLMIEQQKLSRKVKGSSNYTKQKQKVAKLQYCISNQRKDFQHKLSASIVKNFDMICLEDLNVKDMKMSKHFNRHKNDAALGELVRQIMYKSEWNGKTVIKIGRYEPSSQLCSVCGYQNKKLTLDDRTWNCPVCETVHNRDLNAAINIRNIGLKGSTESFKYYNENVLFGVMDPVDTKSI